MPENACRISSDPTVKAAWEACHAAETKLEAHLLAHPALESRYVDAIGTTYFLADGRMLAAPTYADGSCDRDLAFHRDDYEGMGAEHLQTIVASVDAALLNADGA